MDGQQGITQAEWEKIAGEHGGVVGATPIDPYVPVRNASGKIVEGVQEPNPRPSYRYVFRDGTYLVMRGGEISDPGTAFGPKAEKGAGTYLHTFRDGSVAVMSKETNKPIEWLEGPAPGGETQYDLREGADGRLYRIDRRTGQATPVEGIPGAGGEKPQFVSHGGAMYRVGPSGELTQVLGREPPQAPQRAPRYPEEVQLA